MIGSLSPTIRELLLAETEDELFDVVRTGCERVLSADQSAVIPAAECTGGAQAWASTGSLDVPQQEPLLSGIIGQAYASGATQVIDDLLDTRSASSHSQQCPPAQYRSLLCVPVAEWGVLVAVDREAAAFSESDVDAVELLQSFIGAASKRITTANTQQGPDEQVDEFARIIAHDIRNPLTVANGRLEMAREEHDSPHLEQVSTALHRIEDLIDDVVIAGQIGEELDVELVDLEAVAERAWSMVDTGEANQIVEDSLVLRADESLVCQVFENLFRNAITHGGATVTVQVGVLTDEPGFYVADDGPGIPTEKRETIFEYGYSSSEQGMGLGMYIVKRIVEAHGWDITATESAEGGARFELVGVDTADSPQH